MASRTINIPATTDLDADELTSGTVPFARLSVGTGSTQVAVGNHTHTGMAAVGQVGLLAVVSHNPGSLQTQTASTSDADVDAANLVVSLTVPTSGAVLVGLSAMARRESAAQYLQWTLRQGSTTVATQAVQLEYTAESRVSARFLVSGLTPATTVTYKWGHLAASGGAGRTKWGGIAGAAVMEVWAAP